MLRDYIVWYPVIILRFLKLPCKITAHLLDSVYMIAYQNSSGIEAKNGRRFVRMVCKSLG